MSDSAVTSTTTVSSVCPYCGVGCGLLLETDGKKILKVSGDKNHPSNFGRLCTKGSTSAMALRDSGRMESAFLRNERGRDPVQIAMDEAITASARRLRQIIDEHGPDAVALYVSGQMSTEAQYLANKLAKGFIGTTNIESNSRLCMASAGMGYKQSLGADAPPGSYQDFERADVFLVIGANMADCHPILFLRMMDRVKQGAKLIVVDPRRTGTAEKADLFLQLRPGTDLALLNGLLHLLHRDGQLDPDFIASFTEGWEAMPEFLADYAPDRVAEITGLAVEDIVQAARWIGAAQEFMTCWTMGLNQSTNGTWHTNAICNLHLATGKICRPGSGPFSLTGQPNAMGGREMGYMGPGLPGQRSLLSADDRAFVEDLWQLEPGTLPMAAGKGTIDLFERMAAGEVKACWIICTNPVASVPHRQTVIDGLSRAELVITQDAFLDTETNRYADILLPGALWAEAEGVMVNSERNLTLMQKAVEPPGAALPDWQIIARIACEMGYAHAFTYASAEEVFEEIKRAANPATGYDLRGASYARLRETPLQWPCPPAQFPEEHSKTRNPIRYLNTGISQHLRETGEGERPQLNFATPTGKAVFWPRPWLPAAELPDDDYPWILNTGRLQHQWHTLTKTGKIPTLNKLNPGPFVEVHPEDAARLGVKPNDCVGLTSRRGSAVLPAVVTDRVMPGNCFAPFHWNDVYGEQLAVNAVTNDAIDPVSQQPEMKFCAVSLKRVELIAREFAGTPAAEPEPSAPQPAMAFAPPAADTSLMLIQAFAQKVGVEQVVAPQLSDDERSYLSGFISGLQASARLMTAVPSLPVDAPVESGKRNWINGLLAGMFSRVLPVDLLSEQDKPSLTILWASQTGNAETLAEHLAQQAGRAGWAVKVAAMDDYPFAELVQDKYLVCITSTFGDGDAPDNGQQFWQDLCDEAAPQIDHLQFGLLALGDSSYAQFCGHGKNLDARLQALGARPLLDRLDCDTDFEAPAAQWFDRLLTALPVNPQEKSSPINTAAVVSPAAVDTKAVSYTKTNPYPARLVINRRLNSGGAKDTRQFGFSLSDSGITYEAGDALGVWPQNCSELVLEMAQQLKVNLDTPVLVDARERPLQQALQQDFEICRPSSEALQFIAERSGSAELKKLLQEKHKQELQDWLWGRQLVDLLHEFPIQCTAEEWLAVLKRIQPRLYSISSSPKRFADEIHLTVSAVRYTRYQQGKKIRKGVCSTFLADRAEDVTVPIFVQTNKNFRVPADGSAPVIMVGPGTGIAPFRGFLQERRARGDTGKNWLFFGEQHEASDFYYRDELEAQVREGHLTRLSLAFSRDQGQKVYVQDRMREAGADIWRWLEEGAYFYVCGDASRMAKDVDNTLRDIIAQHGGFNEVDTVNYMRKLNMQKRYLRDVY
ncbi:MAG: bifunctional nitrate reductase/sulfite reductase flavoprotein subunit alpha [Cellvibrio sp.]